MKLFGKVDRLDQSFPEKEIDRISQEHSERVRKALQGFLQSAKEDPQLLESRWTAIREMITHIDNRINYWEGRRSHFLYLGAGLLAAAVAAVVALVPEMSNGSNLGALSSLVYWPLLAGAVVLFAGSIILFRIWNRQNNPSYPFTKAYRGWRWHYRHAEKQPLDTDVGSYTEETFRHEVEKFAANMANYKIRTLESSSADLLDQDLSQLFVLITNEKFKIKFVSELRDCLVKTLAVTFWAAAFVAVVALALMLCPWICATLKCLTATTCPWIP